MEPVQDESVLLQQLGKVDIPIVLRNYPEPPTLTKQEAVPVLQADSETLENESTKEILEQATEWGYEYQYNE